MDGDKRRIVGSREDLDAAVRAAKDDGREVIPHDFPNEGLVGFVICGRQGTEDEMVAWPFHGTVLTPEVRVVRTREVVESFRAENPEWVRADDAVRLRLGLVSYRRKDEGKSDVLYVPFTAATEILPQDMMPSF